MMVARGRWLKAWQGRRRGRRRRHRRQRRRSRREAEARSGRDCAGEIQDEATELLKEIEVRVAKAQRKLQEADDSVTKSQSGSDLTSKVAEKFSKLFSFR